MRKENLLLLESVSNSEAASGLLTGYQGTDALASLLGSWNKPTRTTDTHPRGWVRRAGSTPPCAASFFPYSFFGEEERIWPPEGASPLAWKKFKTQRLPAPKKAIKSLMQCVSNSEAASGPHTSYQGTDAVTSLPGTPYSARLRCLTQLERAPGRDSVKGAVLEPLSRSIK